MWNEINHQTLFDNRNSGGVAPARHEIARRAYIQKVWARHDAEQEAATTSKLLGLISRLAVHAKTLFAAVGQVRTVAPRTRRRYGKIAL